MKPPLTVVLGTYNRAHLLRRSLKGYLGAHRSHEIEIIVLDDGSTDDTFKWCKLFARVLNLKYVRLHKEENKWRDSAAILNIGIRMAATDGLIVCTHPEVIPSFNSLAKMVSASEVYPNAYVCCKPYYLSVEQQAELEQRDLDSPEFSLVPSKHFSLESVRQLPGFYDRKPDIAGNQDYSPSAIENSERWESWVFGGLRRDKWREIGGMWESSTWGTVDVTFLERRRILGIQNVTPQDLDSYVIHQNHDDPRFNVPTPRDMDKCMANVPKFYRPEDAICSHL